jgi:hypothetical protein
MFIRESGGKSNQIRATVNRISETFFSNAGANGKNGAKPRKASKFTPQKPSKSANA